jgi:hypothetical protein
MITYEKFDKTTGTEHIWYKSSNIFYSKVCYKDHAQVTLNEIPGININVPVADVTIVFNRGAQYTYKGVQHNDYVAFKMILNRDDSTSHGKAFNKYIKPYPVEKSEDMDISSDGELERLKIMFMKEDNAEKISKEKVNE